MGINFCHYHLQSMEGVEMNGALMILEWSPRVLLSRFTILLWKYSKLVSKSEGPDNKHTDLIKWCCPLVGTIKINSDGSTFCEFGWAAYGGHPRGNCDRIEGLCGRIRYATPLQRSYKISK